MLIVERKVGQSVKVGDDVKIVLVEIKGSRVKLGIEAPDDVSILRDDARNPSAK